MRRQQGEVGSVAQLYVVGKAKIRIEVCGSSLQVWFSLAKIDARYDSPSAHMQGSKGSKGSISSITNATLDLPKFNHPPEMSGHISYHISY